MPRCPVSCPVTPPADTGRMTLTGTGQVMSFEAYAAARRAAAAAPEAGPENAPARAPVSPFARFAPTRMLTLRHAAHRRRMLAHLRRRAAPGMLRGTV
jgi:hypothetical protein